MSLPADLLARLRLPLIAAPMLKVSGRDLVIAACRNGVMGSFPSANAGGAQGLDTWLETLRAALRSQDAPFAVNLIMHRRPEHLAADVAAVRRHGVEWVITSVGSPEPVIGPLHESGCRVLADVATIQHARRAAAAGADGLVLLSAGAGGQTGWLNGLAFIRAVRNFFDGPLVLAGGVADGHALWAARAAGADMAYMGTRFIATEESSADERYRRMLVECGPDDVQLTRAFTGLPTSMLRPSIVEAGLDPQALNESIDPARASELFGAARNTFENLGAAAPRVRRWKDVFSAGHSIGGVRGVTGVARLVEETRAEYAAAMRRSQEETRADPFALAR